ncbi:hypothetical protein [Plantactinospora sp. GCM10030261]|uniref:hypothetical protein n=1 Tax=Plantactinospora sp. GCM10030261 TaxID=3273420 RepID=UPI00362127FC
MTDPTVPVSTHTNRDYPAGTGYPSPAPSLDPTDTTATDSTLGSHSPAGATSTREKVAEQGREVGHHARDAGGEVARTAQQEGHRVAREAGTQARDLLGQARGQLHGQARSQQRRAASGLRGIGEELRSMAGRGEQSGPATELVRQASGRIDDVAGWLESREPGHLVEDVRGYARRHPVAFLAGAAALGVLAGRLTRGVAAATSDNGPGHSGGNGARAADTAGYDTAGYDTAGYGGSGYASGTAGYGGTGAAVPTPTYEEPVPGGGLYSSNTAGAGYTTDTGTGYEPPAPGGHETTRTPGHQTTSGYETRTGYETVPAQTTPGYETTAGYQGTPDGAVVPPLPDESARDEGRRA